MLCEHYTKEVRNTASGLTGIMPQTMDRMGQGDYMSCLS